MTNVIRKCGTCGLFNPQESTCPVLKMQVDPDKDFCSKHQTNLHTCETCGRIILKPIFVPEGEDTYHKICGQCFGQHKTCAFCREVNSCAFETDPSPLPKLIQQQIQNGPTIIVTTVKNPERVRVTCQKGCPCYNPENDCMRQFNYCERMNHVWNSTTL